MRVKLSFVVNNIYKLDDSNTCNTKGAARLKIRTPARLRPGESLTAIYLTAKES